MNASARAASARAADAKAALVLLLPLLVTLILGACAQPPSTRQGIVGEWRNAGGGVISFRGDGSGYMAGDATQAPAIPDMAFRYEVLGPTNLRITPTGGDPLVIEIEFQGDRLTWHGRGASGDFVYGRVK
jgi:hypothetical protein